MLVKPLKTIATASFSPSNLRQTRPIAIKDELTLHFSGKTSVEQSSDPNDPKNAPKEPCRAIPDKEYMWRSAAAITLGGISGIALTLPFFLGAGAFPPLAIVGAVVGLAGWPRLIDWAEKVCGVKGTIGASSIEETIKEGFEVTNADEFRKKA